MKRNPLFRAALPAIAIAIIATGGAPETVVGQSGPTGAGKATGTKTSISRVDPCSLLTKDEIQHQVELSLGSGKADRLRSNGAVWSITMQPTQRGEAHICQIAWQAKVNGETQSRGDFSVVVTFAGWLTGSVAAMENPLPIPNLGEAYFVGGKSGPPYARVGDTAIGIENFPDTKQAKSGLDLLRTAVYRARQK